MHNQDEALYSWAVIGAGPAGIVAVGKLLDFGIKPEHILWIDPKFNVGDFGEKWNNVPSNTEVNRFTYFLKGVNAFAYEKASIRFELNDLDPEKTCPLNAVVEPLQWVTEQLRQRVHTKKRWIESIQLRNRNWSLYSQDTQFVTKNVILALGAEPLTLTHPTREVIPFNIAIDKQKLSQHIDLKETIGVFGSSHSAILIIRYLVELGVKNIINFYRTPCRYAVNLGDWILFDDTGLKGTTGSWARENIDGTLPPNLTRYYSSSQHIAQFLPECDKVIYAVGFQKRAMRIHDYEGLDYNPHNGIIAPGLFGLGIAYPEAHYDKFGTLEYRVGLFKFIDYLNRIMPLWLNYPA
ncbi:pyridine nucleotide-disulfide oxidoreductase [Legionella impletisoli]|uniref:Pyridine nucleotide-disulfide oxidoreductase n=1 Tax=Legionella impletisoli TaxID=343510 RepID=A0A917JYC1_9GAMM|nr:pyridine nucleotide-disulfide oxidoreductase [Legionella impletisoli]GGI92518.1 pyridine nucleotide-disulfide oxidoreductase [Legionella impletisoli]